MESVSKEAAFIRDSVGVRSRDELVVLNVIGDDRLKWLNGQLTNDVRGAKPGTGVYALAVTVRGKIMADAWVLDRGEHLSVLLPRDAQDAVIASFEQQIIMEDVTLTVDPAARVLSVQGPRAAELLASHGAELEAHLCDELGVGGALVLLPDAGALASRSAQLIAGATQLGGGAVSDAGFELARLRAARPRYGQDFGAEQYPQEAGLIGRAVSFNKGCYLGQEVVCTLENRGRTSKRLVALSAPAGSELAPGSSLQGPDGQNVGQLTSVCADPDQGAVLALGYAKTAIAEPGARLLCAQSAIEVRGTVGER